MPKEERPNIRINGFSGINNVKQPWELAIDGNGIAEAVAIQNYDIDRAYKPIFRSGRTLMNTIDLKNLFVSGNTILGVQGQDLVLVNPDFTVAAILRYGIGPGRLSYIAINDIIVFSNMQTIGFVKDGVAYDFPFPYSAEPFKSPVVPGHLIEYYKGRLLVARGRVVTMTDPLAFRFACVDMNPDNGGSSRQFASEVTMMLAVNDGIWFSDQDNMWWCAGGDLTKMERFEAESQTVLFGCTAKVDISSTPLQGTQGICHYVTTDRGVMRLASAGVSKPITEHSFKLPDAPSGHMFYRQTGDLNQVITILNQ